MGRNDRAAAPDGEHRSGSPEPQAPDSPGSQIFLEAPGRDRRVVLQWDNLSELRPDPITGEDLFEGYRIWRVDDWQRPEGSIGPTPDEWMLVGEYRRNPKKPRPPGEELREDDIRRVRRPDRDDVRQTTPNGSLFYVGRYEWADSSGVINGRVYFYAVTAFGVQTRTNPATGQPEQLELGGSPAAVQKELVVASWVAAQGCGQVRVVPNPYRGGADWDLQPSDCDPTGTKVAFRNLPEGWTRMGIYSLTGDLVIEVRPGDTRVVGVCDVGEGNKQGGTFYWDLISRSGQNIVSGVYLYVVEAPGDLCRGRFVVIR